MEKKIQTSSYSSNRRSIAIIFFQLLFLLQAMFFSTFPLFFLYAVCWQILCKNPNGNAAAKEGKSQTNGRSEMEMGKRGDKGEFAKHLHNMKKLENQGPSTDILCTEK